MTMRLSQNHKPGIKRAKHGMATTVHKLGLPVYGKKINCLFGERHVGGYDRNPSCVLYSDHFHCYSCGVHGDAIDLVRKKFNCSFGDALVFLGGAENNAFLSSSESASSEAKIYSSVYLRLLELGVLPDHKNKAGDFLLKRGLDLNMCEFFGLRYLADPFQAEATLRKEFTIQDLDAAGILSSSGNFMFRFHQLLIPFQGWNVTGYLVGRSLDSGCNPKEIKPRGVKCPYPFLVELSNFGPELYVCEGAIDALSCVQMGNLAIGIPGANCFSEQWLKFIPKSTVLKIVFDSDEAGQRAACQLRDLLRSRGFKSEALHVPAKDMNEVLLNTFGGGLKNGV